MGNGVGEEGPAVVPQPAGAGRASSRKGGRLKTLAGASMEDDAREQRGKLRAVPLRGPTASAKTKRPSGMGTAEPTDERREQTLALASRARCAGATPKRRNGSRGDVQP